jgi:ribonuclease VapC
MIFLDASAMIAIIAQEEDAVSLAARLDQAGEVHTSSIAMFEAALGLARIGNAEPSAVMPVIEQFIAETGAATLSVDADIACAAIHAFERFGKGRHPAALNLGDCFAYACAQRLHAAILCKGNDFPRTDAVMA